MLSKCVQHELESCLSSSLGAEQSRVLSADTTSYTIEGLQPDEALALGVAAVIGSRVGEAVTLTARTNPVSGSGVISRVEVFNVNSRTVRVTWLPVSRATGYKITWRREDGGCGLDRKSVV